MSTPIAWPLLVAAGRRRDYTILLAPDFLVVDLDYGVLEQVVRPSPARGPATVVRTRTARGQELSIVYASHLVTPDDLQRADGAVRDEHNRPLRLLYGFVTPLVLAGPPDPADLATALAAALPEYRRFLACEDRADVTASAAFSLRSPVSAAPRPRVAAVAGRRATTGGPTRGRPWVLWVGGAAGVAAIGAVAAVLIASGAAQAPAVPCPTQTPTAGVAAVQPVSPTPGVTCLSTSATAKAQGDP